MCVLKKEEGEGEGDMVPNCLVSLLGVVVVVVVVVVCCSSSS